MLEITERTKMKELVEGVFEIRQSPKGAMLISDGSVEAWVMPRTAKALLDGKLTPAATKALAEAGEGKAPKTACHKVAFSQIVRETDKAVLVADFNGGEAWLPKSAIEGESWGSKSDALIVQAWVLKDKDITHSSKVIWR